MISTYTAYHPESLVTSAIIMGMATATRPPRPNRSALASRNTVRNRAKWKSPQDWQHQTASLPGNKDLPVRRTDKLSLPHTDKPTSDSISTGADHGDLSPTPSLHRFRVFNENEHRDTVPGDPGMIRSKGFVHWQPAERRRNSWLTSSPGTHLSNINVKSSLGRGGYTFGQPSLGTSGTHPTDIRPACPKTTAGQNLH